MNKGFTLVELLGVIAIITILIFLTLPVIGKYLISIKDDLYQRQIQNIESAAKGWAAKNLVSLPENNGEFITIYLGELKVLGLIKDNIKNPVTRETFYNDMEIVILREGDDYVYLIDPETGPGINNFDSLAPSVVMKGQSNEETEINEPYIDKGLIIKDRFGKKITDYRTIIKSNSVVVDEIDTSRFGMYDITYQIDYVVGVDTSVKTLEVYRTVEVTDTKNPVITTPGTTSLELSEVASYNVMNGVSVKDNSLETLPINTVGNISAIPGIYTITYSATDSSGNTVSTNRTIEVVAPQWTFEVTIPAGSLNYIFAAVSSSMDIEWGDDQTTSFSGTGFPTHNYAAPGVYEVTLKGTATKISFCDTGESFYCPNATPSKLSDILTVIPSSFGLTDATAMFASTDVISFSKLDFFDEASSNITNMKGMFYEAGFFNHPIGNWDTSNVTSLELLFFSYGTDYMFNQPIGNWDTSKVTNMSNTFYGVDEFNQPIDNWNTSNVTNMEYMFGSTLKFNQPIGSWNTSKVVTMSGMFNGAFAFNQPIGNWDTSSVTNMSSLFSIAVPFNQPLDNWDTSNVTDMSYMFRYSPNFNQSLSHFNTSKVTRMEYMFIGSDKFNQPIGNWDTSKVTGMSGMFEDAAVFNQNLSGWCVSLIPTVQYKFATGAVSWVLPKPIWGTCP